LTDTDALLRRSVGVLLAFAPQWVTLSVAETEVLDRVSDAPVATGHYMSSTVNLVVNSVYYRPTRDCVEVVRELTKCLETRDC